MDFPLIHMQARKNPAIIQGSTKVPKRSTIIIEAIRVGTSPVSSISNASFSFAPILATLAIRTSVSQSHTLSTINQIMIKSVALKNPLLTQIHIPNAVTIIQLIRRMRCVIRRLFIFITLTFKKLKVTAQF